MSGVADQIDVLPDVDPNQAGFLVIFVIRSMNSLRRRRHESTGMHTPSSCLQPSHGI